MSTLVSEIKTLRSNSDYRVSDVINRRGYRWDHSMEMVLTKPEYENTILKEYLEKNPNNNLDLSLFYECLKSYQKSNDIATPSEDEIVIHLRMGDVVEVPWFDPAQARYLGILNQQISRIVESTSISKITIVTCFAYQVWSPESIHLKPTGVPEYTYTEEKQKKNIDTMTGIFDFLSSNFDQEIQVHSSEKPDNDLVYCSFAKHFIGDFRQPGGFSELLKILNSIED